MPGFVPNEGKRLLRQLAASRLLTDRDADTELALFTNVAPGPTITAATLTEPTGGGYARINLIDGTWVQGATNAAYPLQTFTATGGPMTGTIRGYAIVTKAAAGTPRILAIEEDPNGPYTLAEGAEYRVTPTLIE